MKRKSRDLLAGVICAAFAAVATLSMDTSEFVTWVGILFFGTGAIVLFFRYCYPNNPIFPKQMDYDKELSEEEFLKLYNSNGIFKYNEVGFEIEIVNKEVKIDWKEIEEITAYKIDLLATDEIRLFLKADNGKHFDISENTDGWFQFNEKIKQHFPSINKTWEIDISSPAFVSNETIIYKR